MRKMENERKHTIKISEDMELDIRLPDIMDVNDLYSLIEKIEYLSGTFKEKEKIDAICMRGSASSKLPESVELTKVHAKTHKKLPPAQELLEEYYNQPYGDKQKLANKYHITLGTLRTIIYNIKHNKGLKNEEIGGIKKRKGGHKKFSDERVDEAIKLLEQGVKSSDVASKMGFKDSKQLADTIHSRKGKGIRQLTKEVKKDETGNIEDGRDSMGRKDIPSGEHKQISC